MATLLNRTCNAPATLYRREGVRQGFQMAWCPRHRPPAAVLRKQGWLDTQMTYYRTEEGRWPFRCGFDVEGVPKT